MARRTGMDLLFGDRIQGIKFPKVGDEAEGTILKIDSRQRKAYDPKKPGRQGDPMWWQDGAPVALSKEIARRMELTEDDMVVDPVIVLKTAMITGRGDDGRRRLFCQSMNMYEALRNSTADQPEGTKWEIGGRLRIKYTGEGEPSEEGGNPPKEYQAWYTPPTEEEKAAAKPVPADDPWR